MALRYPAEVLLHLRDSPLCVKPNHLPPAEEWMGAPHEHNRTQSKGGSDRSRPNDGSLFDQHNRRPALDRHSSRTSANPEDLVFGPPRTAFASARSKASDNEKGLKDADSQGRFNLRGRSGDLDGERLRDSRSGNVLRRGEIDHDSEGWSTVKPRKSFGADGAERFHGKMGGNYRDEKKPQRDREDRNATRERTGKAFDTFVRDKEGDSENRLRNGSSRVKLDPWHKPENAESVLAEKRERDRTKSWRDRDPEPSADERGGNRPGDRRWGRDKDQRAEREPEWFDEPAQEKREAHTQQDFQKWMEQMKKAKDSAATPDKVTGDAAAAAHLEAKKPMVKSAPAVEHGPDKFFLAFGGSAGVDAKKETEQQEAAPKPKAAGKSSRFTSFFSHAHEEGRSKSEAPAPATLQPPPSAPPQVPIAALPLSSPPDEERQAFQQLLAKLQKQTMSATPPGLSLFAAPSTGSQVSASRKPSVASPGPFQQYGGERRDSHQAQEIHAPRPQQQTARPEQLLQDLVGQHQRTSSQGSTHRDPTATRNNSNTEFLMNLMRAPSGQPQQQKHLLVNDRDLDSRGSQRLGRPQAPPGFPADEAFHSIDHDSRPSQPTQILQRPHHPPGLDQMPPNWLPGGHMPPPQQRGHMIPPPGLPGGPSRNMQMPPVFPPNFPPGGLPPHDAMGGLPPRNIPMPPPGFFNGPPPHGFVPPGMVGYNGPGGPMSDPHAAFSPPPYENRGMPPPASGANRGGADYGRL